MRGLGSGGGCGGGGLGEEGPVPGVPDVGLESLDDEVELLYSGIGGSQLVGHLHELRDVGGERLVLAQTK